MFRGRTVIGIDDQIAFYLKVVFRDVSNPFRASLDRAFLDFARTIHYPNSTKDVEKRAWGENVNNQLFQKNTAFYPNVNTQNGFNRWHNKLCSVVIDSFRTSNIKTLLTYGQTQKWLNMTLKYLFLLDNSFPCSIIPFLHVPIDNVILDVAKTDLGINRPPSAWSKWNTLEYIEFQKKLRGSIRSKYNGMVTPFEWEFKHWS